MADTALQKKASGAVAGAMTDEQVDLIKRTVARGASNDELALFMHTAQRMGLDPLAKQIHAVKRWDKQSRREVMAIQVGIDGLRLVADRTGKYAPGRPTEYEVRGDNLVSATAYVRKFVGGEWHEVGEAAYYDEYVATKRDGKPNRMWSQMPRVMLAKCAEARALRRAFPAELSGVYAPEEMDQAGEVVTESPKPNPQQKADAAVSGESRIKDLWKRAESQGVDKELWRTWLGEEKITKDKRTQTQTRLDALEGRIQAFVDTCGPTDDIPEEIVNQTPQQDVMADPEALTTIRRTATNLSIADDERELVQMLRLPVDHQDLQRLEDLTAEQAQKALDWMDKKFGDATQERIA